MVGHQVSIIASCHASPVIKAAEHDLDAVEAFLSELVVSDGDGAVIAAAIARLNALLLERVPEPFGIIAAIGQDLAPGR